jgi:hypothetical protein
MYGDNLLIPGDCPFDWNGWGPGARRAKRNSADALATPDVPAERSDTSDEGVDVWRAKVESIVESALATEL